MMVGVPDGI